MAGTVIDMEEIKPGLWEATINGIKKTKGALMVTGDATGAPFWDAEIKVWEDDQNYHSMLPVEMIYRPARRWASAIKSPKGHFITHVAVLDAFRSGWDYVEPQNHKNKIDMEKEHTLKNLASEYKLKHVHTKAVQIAKSMAKSLAIKMPFKGYGRWEHIRTQYRVIPLQDEYIQFDETGNVAYFNPVVMIGRYYKQLHVLPKDAVLYINKPDPFGNTYQGIPETYTIYDQLKWMANIERGFATAIDARGISMIQVAIKGFELEDRDKWQRAYGDPSSYNVLFTDAETDVKNIPGVAASFDLNLTNDAMTKEVASSSGYAMSRIDGTQRGQVSGTQQDTDNYYAMISTMQEEFENELIELHEKLRPDLVGGWDVSWEVVQKMDKQRKAEIFATEVNSAQVALDFLTYNQILDRFGYDPVQDGDVQASIYIDNMYKENNMDGMPGDQGGNEDGDEPQGKGNADKQGSFSSSGGARKPQMKMPNKNDDERANKNKKGDDGGYTQCKMILSSGRQCLNNTDNPNGFCYRHEGGKKGGKWGSKEYHRKKKMEGKRKTAERMRKQNDSNREINEYLQNVFGDGLSFNILAEINEEVLKESRSNNTKKDKDLRGIDELNVAEIILMLGYDSTHPVSQLILKLHENNKTMDEKLSNKEIIAIAHERFKDSLNE